MDYIRLCLLVCFLTSSSESKPTDEEFSIDRSSVDEIWEDWLQQPKLEYEKIEESDIGKILGVWEGMCIEDNSEAYFSIVLNGNGTWESKGFRQDNEGKNWYLFDGLILLYEENMDEENLASNLCMKRDGTMWLLNADCQKHYALLTKK